MKSSLSHVALLVTSADASAAFLRTLKIETEEPEVFESEGTKEVYVGSYGEQKGLLLLVEAISKGPYQRALTKRGPSLHHIAIDVADIEECLEDAQDAGWSLHPISSETMEHNTAWLFVKGLPVLIEVHQKKAFSTKPAKISKLELPIEEDQMELFESLGLDGVVVPGTDFGLVVDGHKLAVSRIVNLK